MKKILCCACLILFLGSAVFAEDKVVLKDGQVLHGRITEDDKNKASIQMDVMYVSQSVARNQIESVERDRLMVNDNETAQNPKAYKNSNLAPAMPPLPEITPEQAKALYQKRLKSEKSPNTQ